MRQPLKGKKVLIKREFRELIKENVLKLKGDMVLEIF